MRYLSIRTKIFICIFTTIICFILTSICLNKWNYVEENVKQNYDYSKIKEYQGKVLYTKFEHTTGGDNKHVYIELENGKTISIGIGGANSPKDNEIVTVYTDDDNYYSFNKDGVAVKYSGFGYMIAAAFNILAMIAIYKKYFGWKGMLFSIFICLFFYGIYGS